MAVIISKETLRDTTYPNARLYWITLGITLMIGFFINFVMMKTISTEWVLSINKWVLIIGYFACAFTGVSLSVKSDNPIISFIGYLMVVVPVGIVSVPFIHKYDPEVVQKAVLFTTILTGLMALAGAMFTSFFRSIGGILFWALILAIIAEVLMLLLGYKLAIMDYVVAIIFLGFIGHDFVAALDDEATIDAAVDRAVHLYLDIFNLFVRVLSIFGKD
jgi:FtsH-binding integral membrane protein